GTSRISGQLVSVVDPSASNAAAISFRTEFLAPSTFTAPCRRAPPQTLNRSFTPNYLTAKHQSGAQRSQPRSECGPRACALPNESRISRFQHRRPSLLLIPLSYVRKPHSSEHPSHGPTVWWTALLALGRP